MNCEESQETKVGLDAAIENLATAAVDSALQVHRRLGPGLLESVYSECLAHELRKRGYDVRREVPIPVIYDEVKLEIGFRADLVIDEQLLIELKAVDELLPVHASQIITYLKLSQIPLGLLINFKTPLIKNGIKRYLRPDLLPRS